MCIEHISIVCSYTLRGTIMDTKKTHIEIRDIIFSIVMIISSFVLTYSWLTRFGEASPIIIFSAMVLIASLASMILSVELRLRHIEMMVENSERSLRINIQSLDDKIEERLNHVIAENARVLDEITKRFYK